MTTFRLFTVAILLGRLFIPEVVSAELVINPKWIRSSTKVSMPAGVKATPLKHAYIIKQYHLGASENTKTAKTPPVQKENLNSIYEQVAEWVKAGEIKSVIAEGCEKDYPLSPSQIFDGWAVSDLEAQKNKPSYSNVVTDVGVKLAVKFGSKIRRCGDNEKLIDETMHAWRRMPEILSVFFPLVRAVQAKDAQKTEELTRSGVQFFHLPPNTNKDLLSIALLKKMRASIKIMADDILPRNQSAIRKAMQSDEENIVLIFGGGHAEGLAKGLVMKGIETSVLEPVGYSPEYENMIGKLLQILPDPDELLRQRGVDPQNPELQKLVAALD